MGKAERDPGRGWGDRRVSETMRRPIPTEFRVRDRSDRVWFYGFARMIPPGMWLGGIFIMIVVGTQVRIPPVVALPILALIFVLPVILDRSKLLDPVDYINFGEYVMVKRIVSKRSFPIDRIRQIELSSPEGEDFDDQNRSQRMCDVAIRFRRAWPAKILATREDVASIASWARISGLKILQSERREQRE